MTGAPETTVGIYNDSIVLVCDNCGDIDHWEPGVNIWEMWDAFNDHKCAE